jgi:hypothetical protein
MKATKAYIASIGTTGVLLGASLLMLVVVSAVVAFDGWPTGNASTRVHTLVLSEKPAPIRVRATAVALASPAPSAVPARSLATVPTVAVPRVRNLQDVAGQRVPAPGSATPAAPESVEKVLPPAVAGPLQPVEQTADPIINSISNPATTAAQVADGAQSATDAAAGSAARISPQVGGAVADAGQAAAEAVRTLPLPGHLLPQ